MKGLSKKEVLWIGFMLFSIFFGAGNLIFPPFLGQAAGSHMWIALAGFSITAVGFPVLGIVAVARSGGLEKLAQRVHPLFASIFTFLIYLSIGPGLAIPRAGSVPYEMAVAPYLPTGVSDVLGRFLFTLVFFILAYWLAITPSKLVDRMGKALTPILLLLIVIMVVGSFFNPLGAYSQPTGQYVDSPFVKGFLEGYLTMDAIGALNLGIVVAMAIKSKGVTEEKEVIKTSIKAGLIAGVLLFVIYAALAHLGAGSGGRFGITENGAVTLTNITTYLFGNFGMILLVAIFILACLTTCVGLITSCSQYFATLTSKISYEKWVIILTVLSMTLANMGLTNILAITVPILGMIYPMAIMLIVLGMMDKYITQNKIIYPLTIGLTGVISILYALGDFNITLGATLFSKLPLYTEGLGWLLPAVGAMIVAVLIQTFKEKIVKSKSLELVEN